jgi:hypothetical protein
MPAGRLLERDAAIAVHLRRMQRLERSRHADAQSRKEYLLVDGSSTIDLHRKRFKGAK